MGDQPAALASYALEQPDVGPYGGALALVDQSLRELYVPLREQAMARADVALKVAVMGRAGFSRGEMADRLAL